VVKLVYDPVKVSFKQLLKVFFAVHDPTTLNRQGNDVGTQYRSVIFYTTSQQRTQSLRFIDELTAEKVFSRQLVTQVEPLLNFYPAEAYHQDYFRKNPHQAYCQLTIAPKVAKSKKLSF
jgi:peptide-methionine (S)-S-oxide reductase